MKGRIDRKCCFRVNLQKMHFTMKAGGSCENAERRATAIPLALDGGLR